MANIVRFKAQLLARIDITKKEIERLLRSDVSHPDTAEDLVHLNAKIQTLKEVLKLAEDFGL